MAYSLLNVCFESCWLDRLACKSYIEFVKTLIYIIIIILIIYTSMFMLVKPYVYNISLGKPVIHSVSTCASISQLICYSALGVRRTRTWSKQIIILPSRAVFILYASPDVLFCTKYQVIYQNILIILGLKVVGNLI